MARQCATCVHSARPEIDDQLRAGARIAEVARAYGLNDDALTRHKANHLGQPAKEPKPGPSPRGSNPLPPSVAIPKKARAKTNTTSTTPEALMASLQEFAAEQLEKVRDPNLRMGELDRTKAAQAAINALEKIGRIQGTSREVSDAQLVKLPAFRRCVDTLLAALRPFPPALAAAATALAQLAEERA